MKKINNFNQLENSNSKKVNWIKWAMASLVALLALNQPANAKDNNLENALKAPEGYKVEKVYKLDSNDSKMIVFRKNEYEPNLKVYWVWQQIEDNVYNWVGARFDWPNYQTVIEKWGKYTLVWWVYKFNFTNKVYSKFGASYLKLKDYTVWTTSIDPEQKTAWLAFGYWNDNLNAEIWHIRYYLDWANDADGTSWKNYVELLAKIKSNLWTNYLILSGENTHALWETENSAKFTYQYQPNNDTQLGINYDTKWAYTEHDYKVEAGVEYKFGSKKVSPYVKGTYNLPWEHTQVSATYEKWIWDKSIQMKDEFEKATIWQKELFVAEVAQDKFNEKADKKVEPTPEITTLEDTEVVPISWISPDMPPEKISKTEYYVRTDSSTEPWTIEIKFEWNEWTETITVTERRDAGTKTYESKKYPWQTVTIHWDRDWH